MCSHCELSTFFTNSIWIVPQETLLAYETINNVSKPVSDQTVWVIDSYQNGYIFGTSYTMLDNSPSAKTKIVGSITPKGDVLFSFISNNVTTGQGNFTKGYFTMQMNSLNTLANIVIGLSHWSYMCKLTPNDPRYCQLPGTTYSLPQFLAQFN